VLRKRVQDVVDLYWAGNVKAAAGQLGIPQNTLYRVVSGETPNPRVIVLQKIAKFAGTTVEYLLTGEGPRPRVFDEKRRPLTGGTIRFFGLLEALYPDRGGVRELFDAPLGPSGFFEVVCPLEFDSAGVAKPRRKGLESLGRVTTTVAEAWADLLEEAISVFGAETVRKRLDASEFAVGGGFTPFATFLAKGGMPKAQATRCLSAWEDELTRDC